MWHQSHQETVPFALLACKKNVVVIKIKLSSFGENNQVYKKVIQRL